MKKKHYLSLLSVLLLSSPCMADETAEGENNTQLIISDPPTIGYDKLELLDEVEICSNKEEEDVRQRAASATELYGYDFGKGQIETLKNISLRIPNLLNPEYGSKTTSAIYIRGIGSRMDQPSVGLYVDGIPYLNKSAFDFEFTDISSLQVMRGPQGTLYGRNAMAGIFDIHTKMPSEYRQTDISATYGNYNKQMIKAAHYNHIGKVGLSFSGYYNHHDGFFTNHYNNKDIDDLSSAGGRLNLNYQHNRFLMQFTSSYDYSEQNGYPYQQIDSTGKRKGVNYNLPSKYYRQLLSNGLRLQYKAPKFVISSATSYQYLDDNMSIDNDFTAADYFKLTQKQREHDFSEEITLKKNTEDGDFHHYSYLFGISTFRKKLNLNVPMIMEHDGIEQYIEGTVNNVKALQTMGMSLDVREDQMPIISLFENLNYGCAAFHQSTFNIDRKWQIAAGLRLDYEKAKIDYNDHTTATYIFNPYITDDQTVISTLNGSEDQNYTQVLPKLTAKYKINDNKLFYASIAKGYKSGGYNTQMFADILQYKVQTDMKEDLYNKIVSNVENLPDIAKTMMGKMLLNGKDVNVHDVISYEPEFSWNYELGTHLNFNDKLYTDAALFFINCKDQQITVFSDLSGMGRMMENAGHTTSYGAELSGRYLFNKHWSSEFSYGYTHATFKDYQANDSVNYKGNYVPFAPQQTFMAGLSYQIFSDRLVNRVMFNVNYSGAANIYWNEENSHKQDFYGLLNANISINKWGKYKFTIWGKNLINATYDTFYFESMGRKFVQCGRPIQVGCTLDITLNHNSKN